jgi:hypothetical protein
MRSALTSIIYKRSIFVDVNKLLDGPSTLNNLISVDVKEVPRLQLFMFTSYDLLSPGG